MKIFAKRIATVFIAAALTLGFAMGTESFARGGQRQGPPPWMQTLNAEQQTTAKKILDEHAAQTEPLRKALDEKRAELKGLLQTKSPDTERIRAIQREIGELRGKLLADGVDMHDHFAKAGLPVEKMHKGRPGDLPPRAPGEVAPRLNDNLTAAQKEKARQIINESLPAMQATRKSMDEKRAQLGEIMHSQSPDKAAIERLSREIGELRGQEMVERIELRQKFAEAGLPEKTLAPRKGKPGKGPKGGPKGGHRPDAPRPDGAAPAGEPAPAAPAAPGAQPAQD